MNTTIPLTLLLMGLTGGLHCAAMCGGLVVASERAQSEHVLLPARRLFLNQVQLQGARVLSYAILGGIAGLDGVNGALQQANALQQQFVSGTGDVSLSDVMLASQKASLSFQAALQVRNKLVSAYQDIMNIQA
ncbi:MAG: flagellar hook-basal body complex protein FliE [Thiomonas sp.]